MVRRTGTLKTLFAIVLTLGLIGASWFGGVAVEHVVRSGIRTTAEERVLLYKSTLTNAINRLQHLPLVISQHPAISNVLATGEGLDQVRNYLSSINTASNAAVLYVIDTSGRTIASSNWQDRHSFEGRNYGFRPYFLDALAGGEGRLFAIGVTTSRAGYFIARPVYSRSSSGGVLGVIVVKIELEQLRLEWGEGGEDVLVTDPDGVVIISSDPSWIYRTIAPLPAATRNRIVASQTFIGQDLTPLDIAHRESELDGPVTLDGTLYHATSVVSDASGLAVVYLAELGAARNAKWLTSLLLLATGILSLVLFLYLRERRRKQVLHEEALEARKMRAVNQQLEAEIGIRKQTEAELRDTQNELLMAGKMAALGRMSAAIAHEVNQPIAAIRTFAASCKLLLDRGRIDGAGETLDDISQMTDRLAVITGDLKLVARNSNDQQTRFILQDAIAHCLKLFDQDFSEKRILLEQDIPQEPVRVDGSMTRLEQVLINIIRNAIDAMSDAVASCPAGKRVLSISLCEEGSEAVLRVQDTGNGLSADAIDHLFDPFFTTKPVGEGTGLGLAISYGLVEEMGGKLRARNLEEGGALFSVRLKLAKCDEPADRIEPESVLEVAE